MGLIDPKKAFPDGVPELEDLNIYAELRVYRKNYYDNKSVQGVTTTQDESSVILINLLGFNQETKTFTTDFTENKENFGITSISMKLTSSYVPEVDVEFTDVRGQSLFRTNEESPYSVLFDFPPPVFELTLKGFFGKKVRYRLHLVKQNSKFDGGTGNFIINASFVGLTFAPLSDIPVTFLKAAPYIFNNNSGVGGGGTVDTTVELISVAQTVVERIQKATKEDKVQFDQVVESSSEILNTFFEGNVNGNVNDYFNNLLTSIGEDNISDKGNINGFGLVIKPNNDEIIVKRYNAFNEKIINKIIADFDKFNIDKSILNLDSFPTEEEVLKKVTNSTEPVTIFNITNIQKLNNIVRTKISELTKEKNERGTQIVNNAKQQAIAIFGADITLRNVFTILLRDVDLFTSKLYDVNRKVINDSERSKFKKKDSTPNDPKAVPFPTWTTKQVTGKVEKIVKALPPENFEEVRFIDELIKGVLKAGVDQQSLEKSAIFDANTETGNTDWLSINAFDTDADINVSPYDRLNDLSSVYKRLISRANSFINISLGNDRNDDIVNNYAQAEAYNIANSLKVGNDILVNTLIRDMNNPSHPVYNQVLSGFYKTNVSKSQPPVPKLVQIKEITQLPYVRLNESNLNVSDILSPVKESMILFFKEVKETLGYDTLITSGFRTFAEQKNQKNNNKKNAKPGMSLHEIGRAIDVNFTKGSTIIKSTSSTQTWLDSGIVNIARNLGLRWGGEAFSSYYDPVHFEYVEGKTITSPVYLNNLQETKFSDRFEIRYQDNSKFTRGEPKAYTDEELTKLKNSDKNIQRRIYDIADNLQASWFTFFKTLKPKFTQYNAPMFDVFTEDILEDRESTKDDFKTYDNFIAHFGIPDATFWNRAIGDLFRDNDALIVFKDISAIHKMKVINVLHLYLKIKEYGSKGQAYPKYIINEFERIYKENEKKFNSLKSKVVGSYNTYFDSEGHAKTNWNDTVYGDFNKNVYLFVSDPKDFIIRETNTRLVDYEISDVNSEKITKFLNKAIETLASSGLTEIKTEKDKQNKVVAKGLNDKDLRTELYYNVKSFHDRWILGDYGLFGKNNGKTLLDSFKFVDRGFNDIGDELILDLSPIAQMDLSGEVSLYSLLLDLLVKNSLEFFVLPNYISYGDDWQEEDPKAIKEIFGTTQDSIVVDNPVFICMYVGGTSANLGIPNNIEDMNDGADPNFKNTADLTKVNAFKVTYGEGTQSLFTSISLDQAEFKETLESIRMLDQLAKAQDETVVKPQNLFNTYEQRSYACEVTMLGNVMIQPTMYFSVDIPLFKGAYLITEVSHAVTPNTMTTTFKGVRVPDKTKPFVESYTLYAGISINDTNITNEANTTTGTATGGSTTVQETRDFLNAKADGKKIEKVGQIATKELSPKMKALLDTIAYSEATIDADKYGGYSVLYGFKLIPGWTEGYGLGHQGWRKEGANSSAAGRYQFQEKTWKGMSNDKRANDLVDDIKGKGNKAMSARAQDIIASLKIKDRLNDLSVENINQSNIVDYFDKLAHEWVSLPKKGDVGASDQKFLKLAEVSKVYFTALGKYS